VKTKVNVVYEDVADNKFLECAFDGKADFLVTGDEHLLRIGHYKVTRIVSVRQFLRILKEQNHSH
jgi:predicted nucleic acid-binding protein